MGPMLASPSLGSSRKSSKVKFKHKCLSLWIQISLASNSIWNDLIYVFIKWVSRSYWVIPWISVGSSAEASWCVQAWKGAGLGSPIAFPLLPPQDPYHYNSWERGRAALESRVWWWQLLRKGAQEQQVLPVSKLKFSELCVCGGDTSELAAVTGVGSCAEWIGLWGVVFDMPDTFLKNQIFVFNHSSVLNL